MDKGRLLRVLVPSLCSGPTLGGQITEKSTPVEIRDIRGPIEMDSLPPFGLSGGLVLLVVGFLLAHRRLHRRAVMADRPSTTSTPHTRDQIAELADGYRQGVIANVELIVRLDALVRDILDTNAGISAAHLTSNELARHVRAAGILSEIEAAQFDGFLSLCDRVKFAGHRPAADAVEAALRVAADLRAAAPARPAA